MILSSKYNWRWGWVKISILHGFVFVSCGTEQKWKGHSSGKSTTVKRLRYIASKNLFLIYWVCCDICIACTVVAYFWPNLRVGMGGWGRGGVGGNFGAFCETNQAAALVRPPVVRWDLPRAQLVLISNLPQNPTWKSIPGKHLLEARVVTVTDKKFCGCDSRTVSPTDQLTVSNQEMLPQIINLQSCKLLIEDTQVWYTLEKDTLENTCIYFWIAGMARLKFLSSDASKHPGSN